MPEYRSMMESRDEDHDTHWRDVLAVEKYGEADDLARKFGSKERHSMLTLEPVTEPAPSREPDPPRLARINGEKFATIRHYPEDNLPDKYQACTLGVGQKVDIYGYGESPEEAIADLCLQLDKVAANVEAMRVQAMSAGYATRKDNSPTVGTDDEQRGAPASDTPASGE